MTTNDATPREALSVTFACGSQEYWDLEPDGSIHLDIRQDQAVVSSDHPSEPDAGSTDWIKEGTMLGQLKEAAISGRPFMLTVRDDDGEKQYRFWPEEMIKATNDGVKEIEWMP